MITEFEKNLIYVFSKEKFEETPCVDYADRIIKDEVIKSGVPGKLDGYEVTVITKYLGEIPVLVNGKRKNICILSGWTDAYWKYEEV